MAEADDVARVILFAASDLSMFMTGCTPPVDGGIAALTIATIGSAKAPLYRPILDESRVVTLNVSSDHGSYEWKLRSRVGNAEDRALKEERR